MAFRFCPRPYLPAPRHPPGGVESTIDGESRGWTYDLRSMIPLFYQLNYIADQTWVDPTSTSPKNSQYIWEIRPFTCASTNRSRNGFGWIMLISMRSTHVYKSIRKESIQPQVPLRLPCYDLFEIMTFSIGTFWITHTYACIFPQMHIYRACIIQSSDFKKSPLSQIDRRCVQGPGTCSPRRADPRLLAIPASWCRIADTNPNKGSFWGFAQTLVLASFWKNHCSTCVAQLIRAMMTWRRPHLPPVYHWQYLVSYEYKKRVAFVQGLNQASHDTNWRQPCSTCTRYVLLFFKNTPHVCKSW